MILFQQSQNAGTWGIKEWDFFLDDVSRYLAPGGASGSSSIANTTAPATRRAKRFFETRGAQVISHRIISIKRPARRRNCASRSLKSALRRDALHDFDRSLVHKGGIGQFAVHFAQFVFDFCDFLVEPVAFCLFVAIRDEQK